MGAGRISTGVARHCCSAGLEAISGATCCLICGGGLSHAFRRRRGLLYGRCPNAVGRAAGEGRSTAIKASSEINRSARRATAVLSASSAAVRISLAIYLT